METWPRIPQRCFTEKDILILSLHQGDPSKEVKQFQLRFQKKRFPRCVWQRLFKKLGCITTTKKKTQKAKNQQKPPPVDWGNH